MELPESIDRKSVLPERPEPIMKKGIQLKLEASFTVGYLAEKGFWNDLRRLYILWM